MEIAERSCTFPNGTMRPCARRCRERRGRSSSRRSRARGWTTSRRPRFAAPPTIWRGLASPWRMRLIQRARRRSTHSGRNSAALATDRPRAARRQASARHLRHGQRQRGSDRGGGKRRVGAARGRTPVSLAFVVPECNSLGAALLGGRGLDGAVDAVEAATRTRVIILENDLYRRGHAAVVRRASMALAHVIVIDHVDDADHGKAPKWFCPPARLPRPTALSSTTKGAHNGFSGFSCRRATMQESWRWIRDLMMPRVGRGEAWQTLDDVIAALASDAAGLAAIRDVAPPAIFRMAGREGATRAASLQRTHRHAAPTSASTSRSRPTIPIRRSRFPWKATRTSRLLR